MRPRIQNSRLRLLKKLFFRHCEPRRGEAIPFFEIASSPSAPRNDEAKKFGDNLKFQIRLKDILKGNVVIVGIGNSLRGDDGFGPALIERLKGEVSALCIDAQTAPENYIGKIAKAKPDTILIADSVHLRLLPGECRILTKSDILNCGLSTHDISPAMLIGFLEKETRANIYLLGVQPKSVSFAEEMSDDMKKALEEVTKLIKEALRCTKLI